MHVLRAVRRFLAGCPLLPPLAAVACAILAVEGGRGVAGALVSPWALGVAAAVLVAVAFRLWRISAAALLCGAVALLYAGMLAEDGRAMRERAFSRGSLELQGRVVRELERGCIVSPGWNRPDVVVRGDRNRMGFALGDSVRVRGVPTVEERPPVPGMFDPAAWRRGQGIAISLDFVEGENLGHTFSFTDIRRVGLDIRARLLRRMMPPGTEADPRRQVLCAMVLGDKSSAEDETMDVFRKGGCLHVFAVSGLHVGLVFGIFWKLFLALRAVRPKVARPLILLLVGAYVLVTGCAVPAVRAFLMLALMMLGLMLRRRVGMANIWCFAALATLLASPCRLFDAGFLLSFSVYAGICLGVHFCRNDAPLIHPDPYLPRRLWNKRQRRMDLWERNARACVVVSLSAWLVSLPVTVCFFHTVTPYSVLTNIAIAALLLPLMFCGLAFMLLGWVPLLGAAVEWCALQSSAWLIAVVGFFAGLPHAYLAACPPQPADSAMLLTRFSGACCVLGNPGLLVNCGNDKTASFTVQPALFHSGYRPAMLLVSGKKASLAGGADTMQREFPGMGVLRYDSLPPGGFSFRTAAGEFSVFPAVESPNAADSNRAPVVLWQGASRRILYVGDASVDTLLSVPEAERRADTVVIGRHPLQPVMDPELLRATGAKRIILLPNAESPLRERDVAPQAELVPLHGNGVFAL
ncbi:MAG: ComEC/Rec2 family competence protein [Akkermansia sp.]|nr:ComEC/Rec2 family competence protein [Akkermansia sp.]